MWTPPSVFLLTEKDEEAVIQIQKGLPVEGPTAVNNSYDNNIIVLFV